MRDYTKYKVWNDSIELTVSIYSVTKSFPNEEKFGLISQLRRAAVSIPSNIAEGASRTSQKDFSRFLEIAQGSSFELKTQMIISIKLDYIDLNIAEKIISEIENIGKQISGLRNTLK